MQPYTAQLRTDKGELEVAIRPITRADIELEKQFFEALSPETLHYRFLGGVNKLPDSSIEKLCDVDHHDSMAFIAIKDNEGKPEQIGVVRYHRDDSDDSCEMALTVADAYCETNLASVLMDQILPYAKQQGFKRIFSTEFRDNENMKKVAREFGMQTMKEPSVSSEVRYVLEL